MYELDNYELQLLDGWEEVYKKGQLTLWLLLALKDGPKHMNEVKTFISERTHQTMMADDKSLYRALRRYKDAEMLEFSNEQSEAGPDRKVYRLSAIGLSVLDAFLQRNIVQVFFDPNLTCLLEKGTNYDSDTI